MPRAAKRQVCGARTRRVEASGPSGGVFPEGWLTVLNFQLTLRYCCQRSTHGPTQVPAQDVAAHMERIEKLLTEYVQATLMGDTAWYKQPCVSSDYACPA